MTAAGMIYARGMSGLVLTLLAWITVEMGVGMPPSPDVVVVPEEQMSERAYGREWRLSDDVPAAYDRATRTVYLRNDWNPVDLRSRARLLHELVHHVQNVNGVPYDCPASREPEAYNLALQWLEEEGAADPYATLGIDEFSIWILSRCPDEG
ncbi:MAG TPA: DUF6647 family protein [Burkholderiales bacterium]